ncbi:YeiH family protein [Flexivirga caeni]|uniref:Putative sulfate exporter family transporter n=1 Tax=Flexivirga caeni TaxID=2294115 RepID=A0A3M9M4P5_9MICO|nr:putative sulfate exporter family transporter [Flexivirga caeni]RNI20519.1 putative sulfate exporter family transporter [Flexivirga caeni]
MLEPVALTTRIHGASHEGRDASAAGDEHGASRIGSVAARLPGVFVAVVIGCVATLLGHFAPVVGGPVFGIVLGIVASASIPALRGASLAPGVAFAGRSVLQLSIVVLGTGLSLRKVVQVGGSSLPVMLGTFAVALIGAFLIGKALRIPGELATLIGVGTGICGASAIAAATAVIKPKQSNVAYAIGTIFTFNILAVLLFPPLGHFIGMSGHSFGLWSGTAINDVSSVVAAAYSFGDGAGPYAIVVKLTRSLLIIPIVIFLALWTARRDAAKQGERVRIPWRKVVPAFLIGFLITAALNSLGVIPAGWHSGLNFLGTFLITVALAAIGLGLRFGQLRSAGHRPLLLGMLLWICVGSASLGLQALTGILS